MRISVLIIVAVGIDVGVYLATGNSQAGTVGFLATIVGYILPH
jgi:hypothetical protein